MFLCEHLNSTIRDIKRIFLNKPKYIELLLGQPQRSMQWEGSNVFRPFIRHYLHKDDKEPIIVFLEWVISSIYFYT